MAPMDELEAARLRIYELEDGAVRAQALAFCLQLGLFEWLEASPMSLEELADVRGLRPRILPALLAFLASQELIVRGEDGRFRNSPASSLFLVRSSPSYVGGRGLLFRGFYDAIGHLPDSLTSGLPWTEEGQRDMFAGFGAAEQQWFAEGMFANAIHGGRALLEQVDFSPFRRLLDVGGNAGGYTIAILGVHPRLSATIFDLEAVRPLAEAKLASAGFSSRVKFEGGSFFDDALPGGHDALLLSSILHDWGDDDCKTILGKCHQALLPGGLIVVTEPMLRADLTGPDHPAASGLTMAVLGGENRTQERITELLREALFVDCWRSEVGQQNSVVTARKAK
jgi:hypothetical protein